MSTFQRTPLFLPSQGRIYDFICNQGASRICLPSTKAFWATFTKLLITFFSLFASTFARSLYKLPTKLIGLKSLRFSTPSFFGIRARKVEFRLLTNFPRRWKSLNSSIMSFFTISQLKIQNSVEKPFSPGALSPFRADKAE